MIVLLWSRATRDLLKSFGWGIAALHRLMRDEVAILAARPIESSGTAAQKPWISAAFQAWRGINGALSATLTSPRQRKRSDRAVDRAGTGSPSQSGRFCCRAVALIRQ